ncbi:MAG: PDZ domain-containing protein [Phycisphaerales bacterium]
MRSMKSFILIPALALAPFAVSAHGQATSSSTSSSQVRVTSGAGGDEQGQDVEVRVDNGKVSVILDGKPVPDSRIRRDGGRLVILDDHGKPLVNGPSITVETDGAGHDARVVVRSSGGPSSAGGAAGASAGARSGAGSAAGASSNGGGGSNGGGQWPSAGSLAEAQRALAEAQRAGGQALEEGRRAWLAAQDSMREGANHASELVRRYFLSTENGDQAQATAIVEVPRVMLGVTLEEPNEALLKHLKLAPGTATMLTGVIDGLPAAKAGLEAFDIVVQVDGKRPAPPAAIREALAGKNPGDSLALTVSRSGESRTFDVKLEPYDPSKLGATTIFQVEDDGNGPVDVGGGMKLQLEPYLRQLRDSLRIAPLPRDPSAPNAPSAPGAAANPSGQQDFLYELRVPPLPRVAPSPSDRLMPRVRVVPPGGAAAADADDANSEAQARLDRLEKRLDDMSRKLERLLDKLDRADR